MLSRLLSWRAAAMAALALLLAGCASLPRTVDIPYERLQAALATRFPLDSRFLELLDVRMEQPLLVLQPESNRLRVQSALAASGSVLPLRLQGALDVSFGLRYEPSDASLRMTDVRVERFDLAGLPEPVRSPVVRLGPFLAERMMQDTTLHRFRPEELARAQGWTPSDLRVTPQGVRVTLAPPPR